jgi:hypothetical protein
MTRRKDPQPEATEAEQAATVAAAVEDTVVAAPEPTEPPPIPESPAPRHRSGVLGPLLGGALAAMGGFAVSHFNLFGLAAPDRSTEMTELSSRVDEALSRQTTALAEIGGELSSTAARVDKLEAAPPPEPPDLSRLDDLDRRLAAIEALPAEGGGSTAALTAKLAELERRIAAMPVSEANPALQAEVDAALARLAEAEAAATARASEAEAAANAARRERALDALTKAVASGGPFLSELQAVGDPDLTERLGSLADAGVSTLETLQADFPDAARKALVVAREISTEDAWTDRLVDFLASQTGARSLTPREGDGPDAVLSRAEFALSEGRVADAVAELAPLDPAVRAPLDAWIAAAEAHLAAVAALQAAGGN